MDQFISTDDARERILREIEPLPAVRRLIADVIGQTLAEDVAAPADVPAFDNSAMDGYGFRWADRNEPLQMVGESAAGVPYDGNVGAGQAIRIMTGARVPPGVDTVAMREICEADGDTVRIEASEAKGEGANIRRRATYMRSGAAALRRGARLGGAELGVLASFGRTVVYVVRRPRVTIVTTGTELVEPDRSIGNGQIVNSNAFMLEGLLRAAGAEPTVLPIVPDDPEATAAALTDADRSSDLVVSVGGVSVGDYDYVREVLNDLTGGMQFWKVRMKPGKPLAFGRSSRNGTPFIGLPGNPVSSFVGFHQFVAPVVAALSGREHVTPVRLSATLAHDIRSTPHRRQYLLGTADRSGGKLAFHPFESQSSGNVLITCGCTALGLVEEGVSALSAGDPIDVELL